MRCLLPPLPNPHPHNKEIDHDTGIPLERALHNSWADRNKNLFQAILITSITAIGALLVTLHHIVGLSSLTKPLPSTLCYTLALGTLLATRSATLRVHRSKLNL